MTNRRRIAAAASLEGFGRRKSMLRYWTLLVPWLIVCSACARSDNGDGAQSRPASRGNVRIVVEQTYAQAGTVALPFAADLAAALQAAGFTVVDVGSANTVAVLRVQVTGEPSKTLYSIQYKDFDIKSGRAYAQWCWSGAKVHGTASLRIGEEQVYARTFAGEQKPPEHISSARSGPRCGASAEHAPFDSAFDRTARLELAFDVIGVGWGVEPLVAAAMGKRDVGFYAVVALGLISDSRIVPSAIVALRHPDITVRRSVAEALGNARDRRAVDPLIQALADPVESVREEAANALGAIGDLRASESLMRAAADAYYPDAQVAAKRALERLRTGKIRR